VEPVLAAHGRTRWKRSPNDSEESRCSSGEPVVWGTGPACLWQNPLLVLPSDSEGKPVNSGLVKLLRCVSVEPQKVRPAMNCTGDPREGQRKVRSWVRAPFRERPQGQKDMIADSLFEPGWLRRSEWSATSSNPSLSAIWFDSN
jgi:hypothetical protein